MKLRLPLRVKQVLAVLNNISHGFFKVTFYVTLKINFFRKLRAFLQEAGEEQPFPHPYQKIQ